MKQTVLLRTTLESTVAAAVGPRPARRRRRPPSGRAIPAPSPIELAATRA